MYDDQILVVPCRVTVLDEAGMVHDYAICKLLLRGGSTMTIGGDEKQLAPHSNTAVKAISIMDDLKSRNRVPVMLVVSAVA